MISIAICDDEAVFAEALHALVDAGMKEILYGENSMDERELSYEITVFTNPLMMIDALKTKRFDLAFLDLLMNKESGFGVAQEIRRMRLNTEIAIVTSYGEARNDRIYPHKREIQRRRRPQQDLHQRLPVKEGHDQ